MQRFIVLLRGINVSGKNKLPMAELRILLTKWNFQNIQTYIQSGNIILDSDKNENEICQEINEGIKKEFDYDIPIIIRSIHEWELAIKNYPFSFTNEKIVAFSFLDKPSVVNELEIKNIGVDQFKIDGNVIYLNCPSGFGKTKLTNNVFEKKLKVTATTRNLRTTLKLLELANK